ncbi:hypothetical protein [Micromonospora sp. CA-246542]|uniref:hypothetical protein n=1 Tax=Micromonospora sp. CA-246542 TaxID=3239959 RepID=UPI003D8BEF96
MIDSNTVAVVVAAITTLGGGWQFLSNRRLAKSNDEKDQRLADLEKHKVESQAYERARAHYDAIIDDLMKHVEWLKQELADTKNENERLRSRIEALEKTIEALRNASVIVIEGDKK